MERKLSAQTASLQARLKPQAGSGRLQFERSEWDTPGHMIRDLVRPNRKGAAKVMEMGLVITGPASLIDPGDFLCGVWGLLWAGSDWLDSTSASHQELPRVLVVA